MLFGSLFALFWIQILLTISACNFCLQFLLVFHQQPPWQISLPKDQIWWVSKMNLTKFTSWMFSTSQRWYRRGFQRWLWRWRLQSSPWECSSFAKDDFDDGTMEDDIEEGFKDDDGKVHLENVLHSEPTSITLSPTTKPHSEQIWERKVNFMWWWW